MSPSDRSERISFLREAVARIEAGGEAFANNGLPGRWARARPRPREALARRRSAFFEIAPRTMADGPAAAGFALKAANSFVARAGRSAPVDRGGVRAA